MIFLGHALDQMDERDIDEQVVRQTLWRGAHDGVDMVRGNWRYRRRSGPYVIVVELQPAATAIVVTTIDTRL